MKNKKILVTILILIVTLLIGTINVKAASCEIGANKKTVEVGEDVTITVKFIAAAWNVKVNGNGITGASYASQTSDLSEVETVKTFKLDTSKAGTYTITVSGDITDANGATQDLNKTCTVTVNEKTVIQETKPEQPTTPTPTPEPKPEQSTPEQKPEPEKPTTPTVEQKPEFKDTKKTMYAGKDINLRESWSTESAATSIDKGTELTVTATSSNKVNGYVWYRVTYNGKSLYVASNLLTDNKPEMEEEQEQPVEEKPTVEEPQNTNGKDDKNNIVKDGLKSLQIEGITLSPTFNPEVYEYRTILKENVNELVINAVPAVEGWEVTVAGNSNIVEGENLITIVVYNENGNVEATYQIIVNKNTLNLSETDNILKLGTKTARRNLIIFIAILTIALSALIVVMVLRNKNQLEEDEFTNEEENVENPGEILIEKEQTDGEKGQEETYRANKDKRKGKHF